MSHLFDILNNVCYGKDESLIEEHLPDYAPYMVNRFLSASVDCLFDAQGMNLNYNIPNDVQYKYLLQSLRKKKRFLKWEKREKNDELIYISEYYNCSFLVAKYYYGILTAEQLEAIKKSLDKGG